MKSSTVISFGVYDITAKDDVTTTAPLQQPFTDLLSVTQNDADTTKYATLERNYCSLDGSLTEFPQDPLKMGYWSTVQSDNKGNFTTPIVFSFDFTNEHTSAGLTLSTNAKKILVEWVLPLEKIIRAYEVENGKIVIQKTIENYTAINITFYSTGEPERYLRVQDIKFGVGYIFDSDQVTSCKIIEEVNIISSAISENVCDFTIYDQQGRFNILNLEGAFPALQESQRITVRRRINGVLGDMGTFYLTSWENKSANLLTCKSSDITSQLKTIPFDGGMFDTTLSGFVSLFMPYEYEVSEEIAQTPVKGWLGRSNLKDAIQQVAFACGAIVDCSRTSIIRIYPFTIKPTEYIKTKEKFTGAVVKAKQQYTSLNITTAKYIEGGQSEELFKDEVTGQITIDFSEPVYDLSVTGGQIIDSTVNHAVVEGNGEELILTGKKYIKQEIKKRYTFPKIKANINEKTISVDQCGLLNQANIDVIAGHIVDYYSNLIEHQYSKVLGVEAVGDIIMTDSQNQTLKGYVERQEINLTGGMIVKTTLSGNPIITKITGAFTGEMGTGEWGLI